MCVVFWGRKKWGFFLAFNRDEYILRPTAPSHFWKSHPHILAGRDLNAGGTWLGLSVKAGRVAFCTNLWEKDPPPHEEHHLSRGQLILDFLNSTLSPEAYMKSLDASRYHGFNLVCIDLKNDQMAYTHNLYTLPGDQAQDDVQKASCGATPGGECLAVAVPLETGEIYGLSNGLLHEHWPKVRSGVQVANELLSSYEDQCSRHPESFRHCWPWDALFTDLLGDTRRDEHLAPKNLASAQPQQQQQQQQQQQKGEASGAPASSSQGASEPAAPAIPEEALNVDDHLEYVASARFIRPVPSRLGPYGTRSQIVVAIWEDGTGELREKYLEVSSEDGKPEWREEKHTFAMEVGEGC
ncbi:NRDE protein-domain-containing protein [Dunaliella salina]|uniref:NRDE protein-domain-containing protein n=1 Tax=Dunaliella salina TaxID=3046 RepID=A0ABQ7G829_DUNSA|nr:NRDE protein-domain-containing protein [Dunaliella salina]|eukprot:KAF5830763.1 NRDE protein-domain-containing protein [Dunaliella salina]